MPPSKAKLRKNLDLEDTLLDQDFAKTRTVAQLRTIAKDMNISLTGITRKADIIKILSGGSLPKGGPKSKSKQKSKAKTNQIVGTVYVFSAKTRTGKNIERIFQTLDSAEKYILSFITNNINKELIKEKVDRLREPLEEEVSFGGAFFLSKHPLFA